MCSFVYFNVAGLNEKPTSATEHDSFKISVPNIYS